MEKIQLVWGRYVNDGRDSLFSEVSLKIIILAVVLLIIIGCGIIFFKGE